MSAADILRTYLNDMRRIRNTGESVDETSYYGAMESLFNAVGQTIQPTVFCVVNPRNRGSGIPDGGLFADLDVDDVTTEQPGFGRKPERGVIEAKPTSANVDDIANSDQVERYLDGYGQVLVTNYYQFVLVTRDPAGEKQTHERYDLAPNETDFHRASVSTLVNTHADGLLSFLQHALLLSAPIREPKQLASILAYYARDAKARIERGDVDLSALDTVKEQLEDALGVNFSPEQGDDFFRSTLVQTLFYGIFSAWVLWHEDNPPAGESFQLWRHIRNLRVPAIQELFEQVTVPSRLRPLNIEQVLERTADALNRVDAQFFEVFGEGEAVQYFYEPFLEAFDPELRKQLGVWYTPPEIVRYMVARVDKALRDELGIADGLLADEVYILDPCCGTGAYLVEVLRYIHERAAEREGELMAGNAVRRALLGDDNTPQRVFGFELLPAPFVITHLQIGMLLQKMHAPIPDDKRAGVYLTNALTGWDKAPKTQLMFPELAKERDAAQRVKRKEPILVILGNPPYSGFAGVAVEEERDLSNAYRETIDAPRPQGQGLNDLYVRFFRMAERKITESTGRGIVSYISNYSWLDGLSHPGMRERYLQAFDHITIDSLNGDKYRTGKVIPNGEPNAGEGDPSIFSTPFNREGIQVGTAIATLIRRQNGKHGTDSIHFRDLWGRHKLKQLEAESETLPTNYETITPRLELGYPFMPRVTAAAYLKWLKLPDLFPRYFPGVITARDSDLVDIDRSSLTQRIESYFDPTISHKEMENIAPALMKDASRFEAIPTRDYLLKRGIIRENLVPHMYRPFDLRWIYWEPETKLLKEKSPQYFPHVQEGNVWLVSSERSRKGYSEPQFIKSIGCRHLEEHGSFSFPLYLYDDSTDKEHAQQQMMFDEDTMQLEHRPNLSKQAQFYLDTVDMSVEVLFYHALAIMHAELYRTENAGALRQDWPRIPLPADASTLAQSAALGREVAALLDVERDVAGVTSGTPRDSLRGLAELSTVDQAAPDYTLTGWGYLSRGATMPKKGTVVSNDAGNLDIYLNETTYWRDVPVNVWEYTLGGYPVLKKWLTYRDADVLGRAMRPDEVRTFMHNARRIAALLELSEPLNANYGTVKADTWGS